MAAPDRRPHTAHATSLAAESLLSRTVTERNRQQPWRWPDLDSPPEFVSPHPQSSNRNPTKPLRRRRSGDNDTLARIVPACIERKRKQGLQTAPAWMRASIAASPSSRRELR